MTKNDSPEQHTPHQCATLEAEALIELSRVRPVQKLFDCWTRDLSGRCGGVEIVALYALMQSRIAEMKLWAARFGMAAMKSRGLESEPEAEEHRRNIKKAKAAQHQWVEALRELDRQADTGLFAAARIFDPGYVDSFPEKENPFRLPTPPSQEAVELAALSKALIGKPYVHETSLIDIFNGKQE